ncbi:hypothetical protein [uncultured Aeromicrobium sp.]|uniref:hypothetical protein n=1 Tax=uncultured Aeromicrobium sp. TaxID=337820 RepID=UPI0025D07357|nr:hypothetical protein [uncultured Aeromicrobium sp.]
MPIALRLVLLLALGIAIIVLGRRRNNDALVYGGGALTALTGTTFIAFAAATIL